MAKVVSNPFDRFEKANTPAKPRIVASSYGEVGTLKTSFWLGAPGPILVQTLDQGLEGVIEPYMNLKDIYVADYDLGRNPGEEYNHERAIEARDKFVEDFEHTIAHTKARTIFWDRESDMFSLFSYAEFGTPDKYNAATPKDWDKLKGGIRRLIAMAKASDINFGIIQGMRDEWSKGKMGKTGNRIRNGMDEIDALVHINIEHAIERGEFVMKIGKARGPGGREIQNQTLPAMTFVDFASLVFPDSSEQDWI